MGTKVKIITILVLVAILSIFTFSVVQCQEIKDKAKVGGGRGYFMFGGNIIDIESLNSRLHSKGYPEFSDNYFSIGGGGFGIINRVIIGGEGAGLFEGEKTAGSYTTSLSGGYVFFNVGYIVHKTSNLHIYPLLGIGGGGINLKIIEREIPSFNEVLDNPKRSANLSTANFLLNVAIGGDYLLKLGENEREEGGLVFGFRAGYIFAPSKGDWDMDGIDISGGPKIGLSGPYIRLLFGGGGISK